jgi:mannose-6-phosphate isomerase-like protein (cupin superfamily)
MDWILNLEAVRTHLPPASEEMRFTYALRRGSMKTGLYAPVGKDVQGTHKQDELYIVVSGCGQFEKNGEQKPFGPQDLIFVEAGAEHRFVEFSADFSTWVIFWGPDGGEAP